MTGDFDRGVAIRRSGGMATRRGGRRNQSIKTRGSKSRAGFTILSYSARSSAVAVPERTFFSMLQTRPSSAACAHAWHHWRFVGWSISRRNLSLFQWFQCLSGKNRPENPENVTRVLENRNLLRMSQVFGVPRSSELIDD